MASSDVDQKFLGRLATSISPNNALLSGALYQLLGLSVLLSRKLYRARKLRKLDTSRDTKSLQLYQHIVWLSREGLNILETFVIPQAADGQYGPECHVLAAKLRASFFHIFCLFHNSPPVSQASIPLYPSALSLQVGQQQYQQAGGSGTLRANGSAIPGTSTGQPAAASGLEHSPPTRKGKRSTLRDQIPSITSEASYITNPYALGGPVGTPSPAPPPGLTISPRVPQPSAFILPLQDWLPYTTAHFNSATSLATTLLPGSHPLRLSVALEHAAFLWDCLHEHENARKLARRAIRDVYRAHEGMDDSEFEDAAELVGVLGRMMRRRSWEGTPREGETGVASPPIIGHGDRYDDSPELMGGLRVGEGRSPYSSGERMGHRNGGLVGGGVMSVPVVMSVPLDAPGQVVTATNAPSRPKPTTSPKDKRLPDLPVGVVPTPLSAHRSPTNTTTRQRSDTQRSPKRSSTASKHSPPTEQHHPSKSSPPSTRPRSSKQQQARTSPPSDRPRSSKRPSPPTTSIPPVPQLSPSTHQQYQQYLPHQQLTPKHSAPTPRSPTTPRSSTERRGGQGASPPSSPPTAFKVSPPSPPKSASSSRRAPVQLPDPGVFMGGEREGRERRR